MFSHLPKVLLCSLEKNNNNIHQFGTVVGFSWKQSEFWTKAKAEILLSHLRLTVTYYCGKENYGHRWWIEIRTDLSECVLFFCFSPRCLVFLYNKLHLAGRHVFIGHFKRNTCSFMQIINQQIMWKLCKYRSRALVCLLMFVISINRSSWRVILCNALLPRDWLIGLYN